MLDSIMTFAIVLFLLLKLCYSVIDSTHEDMPGTPQEQKERRKENLAMLGLITTGAVLDEVTKDMGKGDRQDSRKNNRRGR